MELRGGLRMVISKLRRLKFSMKQLSWKSGNLFDKVKNPKIELKRLQLINTRPFDGELRIQVAKEY